MQQPVQPPTQNPLHILCAKKKKNSEKHPTFPTGSKVCEGRLGAARRPAQGLQVAEAAATAPETRKNGTEMGEKTGAKEREGRCGCVAAPYLPMPPPPGAAPRRPKHSCARRTSAAAFRRR